MKYDAFISHASENAAVARTICAALESAGVHCWIAPRDVPPGTAYLDGLMAGIVECDVLLLVFTKEANEANWMKKELEGASDHELRILPVMLEDVRLSRAMEILISDTQWYDARKGPLETHLPVVAASVQALLKHIREGGREPVLRNRVPVSEIRRSRGLGLVGALGIVGAMVLAGIAIIVEADARPVRYDEEMLTAIKSRDPAKPFPLIVFRPIEGKWGKSVIVMPASPQKFGFGWWPLWLNPEAP